MDKLPMEASEINALYAWIVANSDNAHPIRNAAVKMRDMLNAEPAGLPEEPNPVADSVEKIVVVCVMCEGSLLHHFKNDVLTCECKTCGLEQAGAVQVNANARIGRLRAHAERLQQEVERLQGEINELNEQGGHLYCHDCKSCGEDPCCPPSQCWMKRAEQAERRAEELQKDAERLDWLEQASMSPDEILDLINDWTVSSKRHSQGLRAAIDAAKKEAK